MKATKLRATQPWVLIMLLVFLSCLFGSRAQAQDVTEVQAKEVVLTKGKTVSHIVLELTRDAKNWRKPGIAVYRVVKGERVLIGKRRYNKLHAGDIISIPASMVVTKEVKLQGRSLQEFCADYREASCLRSLVIINSVAKSAVSEKLQQTIYVPAAFTPIERVAAKVAAPVISKPKVVLPSWFRQALSKSARWIFLLAVIFVLGLVLLNRRPNGSWFRSRVGDWWSSRRLSLDWRNAKKLQEFRNDFMRRLYELYGPAVREEFVVRGGSKSLQWNPRPSGLTRTQIEEALTRSYPSLFSIEHWTSTRRNGVLTGEKKLVLEIPDIQGWNLAQVSFPERQRRASEMNDFAGKLITAFQEVHTNSLNRNAVKYIPQPMPEKRLLALSIKVDIRNGPQVLNNFRNNVDNAVRDLLDKVGNPFFVFDKCETGPSHILLKFQYLEKTHAQ